MADWNYDEDDGIWNGPNGYTYDPVEPQWYLDDEEIDVTDVPQVQRNNLEATAEGLINGLLVGAANQPLGAQVNITNEFYQGEITDRVTLGPATFGSDGATPCLIVFATGIREGQNVAVGAHLDDQVYQAPATTVQTMIDRLDLPDGEVARFLIFGGEYGCNTNPGGGSTMDYSRYYPFFLDIAENPGSDFGAYNFPSNGAGNNSTGAAITANAINAWLDN